MFGITLMLAIAAAGQGPGPAGEPGKHYTLREKDNEGGFALRVGDTLDVKLPVQLGTGFLWELAGDLPTALEQDGKPRVVDDPPAAGNIVGQPQVMVFRFRAVRPVNDRIVLEKVRPNARRKPVQKFSVGIEVR